MCVLCGILTYFRVGFTIYSIHYFVHFYALFLTDEKRYFIDLSAEAYIVMTRWLIQHILQCTLVDCRLFRQVVLRYVSSRGRQSLPMVTCCIAGCHMIIQTAGSQIHFNFCMPVKTNLGRICLAF